MVKKIVTPSNASKPLGSYSHGILADVGNSKLLFVTGQIAMDDNGNAMAPNNIEEQTEIVFQKIADILNEAGGDFENIVKVTIYLKDIKDFAKVSIIRNKYLDSSRPASTLVEISNTVKEGCDVEIEVVAIL